MKRLILALVAVMLAVGVFSAATTGETPEYTIRVEGAGYTLSAHQDPVSVEPTENNTLLATFEYMSFRAIEGVRFYVDGVRVASAEAPDLGGYGYANTITVEIGLNTPVITIGDPVVRDFYWGPLGYFPLYDQRGGGYKQMPHLLGCNKLLKTGNNEPVICAEEGWEGPEPR